MKWLPNRSDSVNNLIQLLADAPDPAVRDTKRAVELARVAMRCEPVDLKGGRARVSNGGPASQLDMTADKARRLLAFALVCDGRYQEGLDACAEVRANGGEDDGWLRIGEAYAHAKLGDLAAAADAYRRTEEWFESHPLSAEHRKILDRRLARVAELLGPARSR